MQDEALIMQFLLFDKNYIILNLFFDHHIFFLVHFLPVFFFLIIEKVSLTRKYFG